MPPQARVGDSSLVPADAHGCPACPHAAIGPAIVGSANVLTNSLPSVRVGDPGIHSACCGPNIWNAKTGSKSVLINGRKAHRLSDLVQHCGGIGRTVQGSPNVLVGDLSQASRRIATTKGENQDDVGFFVHDEDNQPLAGVDATITGPNGENFSATTDRDGRILLKGVPSGTYEIEFGKNNIVFLVGELKPLK